MKYTNQFLIVSDGKMYDIIGNNNLATVTKKL